jgi:hypothetical protein
VAAVVALLADCGLAVFVKVGACRARNLSAR